jgi:hypothetical protein
MYTGWHYAGSVAVDSGQLLLIDPSYTPPSHSALKLALRATDMPCAEVALSEHQLHSAVACQSGMGDGIYPVHVRLAPSPVGEGQVIAEMRITFLEGEADECGV